MGEEFNIGDIVTRISHNFDVVFRICDIILEEKGGPKAVLKGIDMRIEADAPLNDLIKVTSDMMSRYTRDMAIKAERCFRRCAASCLSKQYSFMRLGRSANHSEVLEKPGKVLHVDSDEEYMRMCNQAYDRLNVKVLSRLVPEDRQPDVVPRLVRDYLPDILVITGHDSMVKNARDLSDMGNYKNSSHFVETVRRVRRYIPSLDELVIFAGACQSNYEALIQAGANFASSPGRVLIHALDPVFICQRIAYSDIDTIVSVKDVLDSTITGMDGIGGVQTRGKYREGLPKGRY